MNELRQLIEARFFHGQGDGPWMIVGDQRSTGGASYEVQSFVGPAQLGEAAFRFLRSGVSRSHHSPGARRAPETFARWPQTGSDLQEVGFVKLVAEGARRRHAIGRLDQRVVLLADLTRSELGDAYYRPVTDGVETVVKVLDGAVAARTAFLLDALSTLRLSLILTMDSVVSADVGQVADDVESLTSDGGSSFEALVVGPVEVDAAGIRQSSRYTAVRLLDPGGRSVRTV